MHALGVDQSPAAVQLALDNVARCGTEVPGRVDVVQGDLFAADFVQHMRDRAGFAEGAGFDLVVSNPPYIPRRDYAALAASVREWEDRRALVGEVELASDLAGSGCVDLASPCRTPASDEPDSNEDGLVFYRRIVSILDSLLSVYAGRVTADSAPTPVVAFEVGQGQATAVQALLEGQGYRADVLPDQWGIHRLVLGYRKPVS